MSRILVCLVVVAFTNIASAGTFDDPPVGSADLPFDPVGHVSAGFEMLGGQYTSVAFRAHALFGGRSKRSHLIPSLAFGGTVSDGELVLDNHVTAPAWSIGPEVMTDIQFDSGVMLYTSAAAVKTTVAYREMGPSGGWGERGALGINLARAEKSAAYSDRGSGHENDDLVMALFVLLPQQFEFTLEHDPGATRAGFSISYGL